MKVNESNKFKVSQNAFGIREEMVWIPIDKLANYKAFPVFFKDELKK